MRRYAQELGLQGLQAQPGEQIPNYDIRPGSYPQIIIQEQAPSFVAFRWGFTPSWAKDPKGKHGPPINARIEGVTTSPTWRHVIKRRRCLVPADAWYEWLGDRSPKQRFCFRKQNGEPFFLAGVWDRWGTPGSPDEILSFAIITREAQPEISHIHDRMPLFVPPGLAYDWLNAANEGLLYHLGAAHTDLEAFPVAQGANGPGLFVNSK